MPHRRPLQKRAHDLVKELGLDGGFTAWDFLSALNQNKDFGIRAASMEMPPGHTGFLTQAGEGYVLLYKENTSWLHQQHIIFHECAHIVLGHRSTELGDFFHRADFDDQSEKEAEVFAAAILEKALKNSLKEKSIPPLKDRSNYPLIPQKIMEEALNFFSIK